MLSFNSVTVNVLNYAFRISHGNFKHRLRGIKNFEIYDFAGRAFSESASAKYKLSKSNVNIDIGAEIL